MEQLNSCVEYFNDLILDELAKENISCWIAGGSVRNYFAGDYSYTDIDVYFKDENNLNAAKDFFIQNGGEVKFDSDHAYNIKYKGRDYDLIKHFFKNPQDSIDNFDFTVACVAVDNEKVYHHDTFFMDLAKRALVINELPYPMSTLSRVQKYAKKGFTICKGGLYKLSRAIQLQLNEADSEAAAKEESETEDLLEMTQLSSGTNINSFFNGID